MGQGIYPETDTSGVLLRATESDPRDVSVVHLLDNSPAVAAGIKEGDTIFSIDQQSAANFGLDGIRLLFNQPGKHHLQLHRGSQTIELDLTTTAPLY